MIDIEAGLLALMDGGRREVELSITDAGAIRVAAIPTAARFAKKAALGSSLESAMIEVAKRINEYSIEVELPLALNENLCHICGLELDPSQPFDGHRECREQE